MKRLIIGLTGHSGTGKSTAASYLAEKYGFKLFENSQALRDDAAAEGIALRTREDYNEFYRRQQHRLGKDYLARRVIKFDQPRILQSGLRSRADLELLQQSGGFIIALVCDPAVALERIDKTIPKNAQTIKQYLAQQHLDDSTDDFGTHVSWVVNHADYQIDTSGPIEQTQAALDRVMAGLITQLDQ